MAKKVYAIFLAGGSGIRMGASTPKQFLPLGGKPVLLHTIESFLNSVEGLQLVITLPKEHMESWKQICNEQHFDERQILVPGGLTRFHSVRNALAYVPDGSIVLIHDGVRPFAGPDLIRRVIAKADAGFGAIPVVPVSDTLKSLVLQDGNLVPSGLPDPDRSLCFAAQTPQGFPSEMIKAAYQQPFKPLFTDDASVAREAGCPLAYVEGEKYNIKLTTPEDMELASKLV